MRNLVLALSLLIGGFGYTQEVFEYPMEDQALLWQITGEDVKDTSYLFGTMHLIQKKYFLFPERLEQLATSRDQLVMELDGMPDPMKSLGLIMLKEGSFFDYFNPEQTDSILVWAKKEMKMDSTTFANSFSKMKPFALVSLATQKQFVGKTESYEETFTALAKENEVPIVGLETIEEQMSIFDNLTKEEQAAMVMEAIRDNKESIELLENMQITYAEQKIDALYGLIHDEAGVIAEKEEAFLKNRNENWISYINRTIEDSSMFIAVGAGHLGGPDGVIRLLQKEGYTLTPVQL